MAFVFFGCETSGANTAYDQILQFGAVLVDDELNERDQFEIRCRILPNIVPSPRALWVNRITARDLTNENYRSHYEMISKIRETLLSWSPAVFVGFNSLYFDEYILRQAFYKTLYPIYLTNTGGNARCDAMRLLQAASIFAPNAISVPMSETDRRTFRLDRIARANGYQGNVHDAMCDVRATIHLCRVLLNRAPSLWSSAIRLCRKSAIFDFITTRKCSV
jgi:exodeoxyribonuclease-1